MSLMLFLHIAFLLIWLAALLYFPSLLVRHADDDDPYAKERTLLMQRALYAYVMTPSALLAIFAGTWLIFERGFSGGWLHVKLGLVTVMVWIHAYCGELMASYRHGWRQGRPPYFRALPMLLVCMIAAIVTLVTAKPF